MCGRPPRSRTTLDTSDRSHRAPHRPSHRVRRRPCHRAERHHVTPRCPPLVPGGPAHDDVMRASQTPAPVTRERSAVARNAGTSRCTGGFSGLVDLATHPGSLRSATPCSAWSLPDRRGRLRHPLRGRGQPAVHRDFRSPPATYRTGASPPAGVQPHHSWTPRRRWTVPDRPGHPLRAGTGLGPRDVPAALGMEPLRAGLELEDAAPGRHLRPVGPCPPTAEPRTAAPMHVPW